MSRIYANCTEAMNEIKRNLYELGIEVFPHSMQNKIVQGNDEFKTKELQNECFTIIDTSDKDKIVGKDIAWCHTEFFERVSRLENNPGKAWEMRRSTWEQFLNKENKMDYTYADRMRTQLDKVIKELKRNQDTRQAIISIHNSDKDIDSIGGKKRVPCSMFYQFMVRLASDGTKKLNMTYVMRSTDYYTHFKNDIWLASELRDYIAKEIGIKLGYLTVFVSSLHMYKKDWETGVY
jgi:thymidylate synthase